MKSYFRKLISSFRRTNRQIRQNSIRWNAVELLEDRTTPAGTFTWIGGGGNSNWSAGANWLGGTAPGNGDDSDVFVFNTGGSFVDAAGSYASVNDRTGLTNVTLQITDTSAVGDFSFTLTNGFTLKTGAAITSNVTTGTGATFGGAGALTLTTGGNTFTSTAGLLTINNPITNAGNLLTVDGAGSTTFGSAAAISGIGGVTYSGSGTLTLGAASGYTGGTNVSSGAVKVGNATALGGNSGTVTVTSGAVLDLNGIIMTGTNPLTLNGAGISGGGALTNSSSTAATYAGLITLGSASTIASSSGNITISNTGTIVGGGFVLTLGGANAASAFNSIIGTTTASVTKAGSGTWTLGKANLYTGGTSVSLGTLKVGNATALGGNAGTVTVTSGAVLDLNGITMTGTNPLTLNGAGISNGGALTNSSGTAGTYAGLITLGSDTTISSNSGNITISNAGTIVGGGFNLTLAGSNAASTFTSIIGTTTASVTKTGAGTWILGGANAYTGTTTLTTGNLQANNATSALGNGGNIFFGGGTLQFGSALNSQTVAWGGRFTSSGSAITLDSNSQTVTVSGAISSSNTGAAGLTKAGAGTVILAGANTYVGVTTINAGALQATTPAALYNDTGSMANWTPTNIIVNSGGTLAVNFGGPSDFSETQVATALTSLTTSINNNGLRSGSAFGFNTANASSGATYGTALVNSTGTGGGAVGLGKLGANTLTLTGVNTYTGATTVSGGILKAGIASVAGVSGPFGNNSAVALANTAGVALDIAGFDTIIGSLAGGGTAGGNVTLGSNMLTTGGNNAGTTYAGVISSNAGLTGVSLYKAGAGQLELQGKSTFTGKIVIDGGTLWASQGGGNKADQVLPLPATPVADSIKIMNGGTLAISSNNDNDGNLSANRGISLDTGNQNINTGSGDTHIAAVITGPGNLNHTWISTSKRYNRLYLDGNNTFTGSTFWNATGTTANYGGVDMSGKPLALQNSAIDANSLSSFLGVATTSGVLQIGGLVNGTRSLANLTNNATLTGLILNVSVANVTNTFTNVIGGTNEASATVTKTGPGTQALNGASTYTGKTSIQAGTLSINTIKAIGGAANSLGQPTTVANGTIDIGATTTGGTLVYTGTGDTTDRVINLAGTTGGVTLDQSGTNTLTFSSNFTATGVGAKTLTLQGSTAGSGVIGGQIVDSSSGATSLIKTGSGAWTLNGANTFTGDTTLSDGTLTIGNALALQNSAFNFGAGTLAFSSGINTPTFGGLKGSTSFSLAANVTTLTLSPGSGVSNSYSGTLGSALGAMNLTKSGAGTQILGAATYTGNTAVNNGKLYLNGANASAAITVAGAATLGGTGSTSATATVADAGIVEAGSGGTGSLTLGGLSFTNTGSISIANIGNYSSNAAIVVSNSNGLSLNGGAGSVAINLTGALPGNSPGQTVTVHLLQYSGSISGAGTFALNAAGLNAGPRALFSLVTNPGPSGTTYVDLQYSLDNPVWSGIGDGNWVTSADLTVTPPTNWILASNSGTQTNFVAGDAAVFNDTASGTTIVAINGGDVSPAAVTFDNSSLNYVVQGANGIAGNGPLTKSGSGTLTLVTNNSYQGLTTISNGTLQIGNGGASGTLGAGSVANNGILMFNRSDNVAIVNAISGSGSVVQGGSGQLLLSAANSHSGGTTLNSGALSIGDPSAVGTGTLTINGCTLDSNVPSLSLSNNNAQVWNNDFTFQGTNDLNFGTGGVSLGSTAGARTVTVAAGALTVGGVIADGAANGLIKAGSGTLALAGANTYSGGTVVNGGTISVNNGATLGANTSPLAVNNPNTAAGAAVALNLNGSVTVGSLSGTIATPSSGANTATINVATNATLTVNQTADLTYQGTIVGGGAFAKSGTAKLTLSGANTFTGGTTLSQGTLSINSLSDSGTSALGTTGIISISGGTLQYTSASSYIGNRFSLSGGQVTFDITQSAGQLTIANNFTNASVTKAGAGTLTLGGNVYYTGNNGGLTLAVDQGVLSLASTITDPAFQTTADSVADVQTGGTLKLSNVNGRQVRTTGTFAMSGGTFDLNGNSFNLNPQISGSGTITNSSTTAATLGIWPSGNVTFTGNIVNGAGTLSLTTANTIANPDGSHRNNYANNPTATWTLSGNNTYSGATAINVGILQAGSTTAFSPNSAYTVASGATLDLAGFSDTIGSLTGAGSVTLGKGALSVGNDNTSPAAFTGIISGTGGSLLKTGTGTLVLSGANSYSGGTNVNGGTLAISNDGNLGAAYTGGVLALTITTAGAGLTDGTIPLAISAPDLPGGTQATGTATVSGGAIIAVTITNSGSGYSAAPNVGQLTGATNGVIIAAIANVNLSATLQTNAGMTSSRAITLTGTAGAINTNGYDSTFSGPITGPGNLTKSGSGTLTLSGSSNTYTGLTTISGGKLTVSPTGAITGASGVSIGAGEFNFNSTTPLASSQAVSFSSTGGTLSGTGTINTSSVTVASGNTLSPGAGGVGTLTFGSSANLTLSSGSFSTFEITGNAGDNTYDKVVGAGGTLTYGGTLNVSFVGGNPTAAGTYTLFTGFAAYTPNGASSGTFSAINLPTAPAGLQWHDFGSGVLFDYMTGQVRLELPPTQLIVTSGTIATTAYGQSITFTVEAHDINNALVPSYTSPVTVSVNTGASGSIFVNSTMTTVNASGGAATFTVYLTPGSNVELTAAASGLSSATSNSFTITTRDITVSGVTAIDKSYDGSAAAIADTSNAALAAYPYTPPDTPSAAAVFGDSIDFDFDALSNNPPTFAFQTATVGTGKSVTAAGFILANAASAPASYYNLIQPQYLTANITPVAPTVTTPTSSSVTATGATLGGNITFDGGYASGNNITARGIVYSTTSNFSPGSGTSVADSGAPFSTGTFGVPVSGLAPGTTYYYRAYATNTNSTSYSSQASFTTVSAASPPTVTSVAPFVGPTSGGVTVIISGANFSAIDPAHLANAVTFGGTNATSYTVTSNSQITAVAPAGSPAAVNVVVTNPGGSSSTAGAADDYTFAAPAITSVQVNGGAIVAKNVYGATPNLLGQQSIVEQLLVTFNQRVNLDANAFNISSLAGSVTASVAVPATAAVAVNTAPVTSTGNGTDGYTQYILTFAAGTGVNSYTNASPGNSFTTIKDGVWQLNVVGSHVHAGLSDTAANAVASKFWALYSAVNSQDVTVSTSIGDGTSKLLSDGVALGEMYQTFGSFQNVAGPPAYNVAYDSNLDGIVDGIDLGKMYANFGAIWQF